MTQSVVVIDPSDGSEIDYTANYRPDKGMEIGGEAFNGETDSGGTIVFDDTAGLIVNRDDLAHGRRIIIREDASGGDIPIHMGRISPRSQYRDVEVADRARSITITTRDQNADLSGIIVDGWSRPAEEPFERIQALLAAYLNGSSSTELNPDGAPWGRASTVIGDGFVNTTPLGTDMPAKDYVETDPREVVRDCCEWAGYDAFVILNDDETLDLFFDDRTGTAYTSTLSISDNDAQVDDTLCFAPIWDLGPAHELDGSEQATGLLLIGGDESRTYDNRPAVEVVNDKWEYVDRSEATEQADLNNNLVALLNARQEEELRIQFSMLVPADSIHLLRPGMRMEVKRAYAAGIGTPTYFRAVQVRYRWVSHEYYKVGVYLGFPVKLVRRYGDGREVPTPPTQPGTASCATPLAQMTQISTPNGGLETGATTNWAWNAIGASLLGPGAGAWEGSYYLSVSGAGHARYTGLGSYTFVGGTTYVARVKVGDGNSTTNVRWISTDLSTSLSGNANANPTLAQWDEVCLEWTPETDVVGAYLAVVSDTGLDNFQVDDVRVYTGGTGDTTEPIGEDGEGDPGTPGTYAPIDHVHEHGSLTGAFDYHDADQISIDDVGGNFTGDTVEEALAELAVVAGVSDHGALTGLDDDDHRYLRDRGGGEDLVQSHGTVGATETIDPEQGNWHALTLDANLTLTLTNPAASIGATLLLELTQDGTGGWTLTLPASVANKADLEADYDTTASTTAFLVLWTRNAGTTWYGAFVGGGGTGPSDPADDTQVWMPLTTVVGGEPELVWDGDDSLIPTLVPI